jgi:hypothetical protein
MGIEKELLEHDFIIHSFNINKEYFYPLASIDNYILNLFDNKSWTTEYKESNDILNNVYKYTKSVIDTFNDFTDMINKDYNQKIKRLICGKGHNHIWIHFEGDDKIKDRIAIFMREYI